ncbi:MAG: acyltransferase [Methanobrevibacter sp.]|nr:acyltransferase [Methanobrevibacter sp.]
MAVSKSKRIFYLDALRAVAILTVVAVHVYAVTRVHVMADFATGPSLRWMVSQFTGNNLRIGVDLFLMLAGALSLGREWSIKEFLGKRIPRIVEPFLFWGLLTGAIAVILSYYFGYGFIYSFDVNSILSFFYGVFMAKSPGFLPYWFFWMILGTYLIMPIFNKWLQYAELEEAEYFLVFWLITCLFDFTLNIQFPIKLSYFVSPIGLVVAGYYLRHTKREVLNNPYFALALTVLSAILILAIVTYFSTPTKFHTLNRYSLPITLEVIGVFLLFKNFNKFGLNWNFIKNENSLFRRGTALIAKYSYGIYLIQGLFLCIYVKILPYHDIYSLMIILFVLIVASSMITMHILNKVKYVNKFIGAK